MTDWRAITAAIQRIHGWSARVGDDRPILSCEIGRALKDAASSKGLLITGNGTGVGNCSATRVE